MKFKKGDRVKCITAWGVAEWKCEEGDLLEVTREIDENEFKSGQWFYPADFFELYQEPQKSKEENLIQEARRRYPIGTKYKDVETGWAREVVDVLKYYDYPATENSDHITDGHGGSVYDGGKWAEIISEPKPREGWEEQFKNAEKINPCQGHAMETEKEDVYDAVRFHQEKCLKEMMKDPEHQKEYEGDLSFNPLIKEATKHDQGKPSFSAIPQLALMEVAKVFTKGREKYGKHNYSGSMEISRYTDASERHLHSYKVFAKPEDLDEIGVHELACVAANALMALDAILTGKGIDDRNPVYKK